MKTVFIFHGTGGYPEENWFSWLKGEMEKNDYTVHVPQFPTPENQTLEAWFAVFEKYEGLLNDQTIVVGHSLGGSFLLRLLERIPSPIATACFVATPIGVPPVKNLEADKPFTGFPFDWKKIRKNAGNFMVFQSDTDPYVSLANGEEIANQLNVPLQFIPNAGHFNKAAGYTEFPLLRDAILKTIKE